MISPGRTLACPAASRRIGPAKQTVATVEPMSTPADRAASPPAIVVVATEAISHGARPTVSTPSRSGPAATSKDTAQDSAGSTVTPTASAASSERHTRRRRRSAAGEIVTAVAKTSTASSTSMPCRAASQASGGRTDRPTMAAASTAASSG